MKKKIPKVIHYCWFGHGKKSKIINDCINSWKKCCPDYEIKEWNENNFDIDINNYVKQAYECKKYAFVCDFARLWIIYNYGGIYFDVDVELIKNIDDLLYNDAFFASEDNNFISTGLGFGSKKNNELIKLMMDDYNKLEFIKEDGSIDKTTCPVRNTKIIKKYLKNINDFSKKIIYKDICFYPKEYFCPLDYESGQLNITEESYAIHWFNSSWLTKIDKLKYFIKKIIKRLKIYYEK